MTESLTDYISQLSQSNLDILDDVISNKYRKFITFFQLIRSYHKYIKKLDYEFSNADTLSITITFSKTITLDDKKDFINKLKKSGYLIISKQQGKKLKLTIVYPE